MLSFSTILSLAPGAVAALLAWVCYLAGKHGWAWVWAYVKARAEHAKTQAGQANDRLTALENEIAALKAKLPAAPTAG